jgi:hypothetical protein
LGATRLRAEAATSVPLDDPARRGEETRRRRELGFRREWSDQELSDKAEVDGVVVIGGKVREREGWSSSTTSRCGPVHGVSCAPGALQMLRKGHDDAS